MIENKSNGCGKRISDCCEYDVYEETLENGMISHICKKCEEPCYSDTHFCDGKPYLCPECQEKNQTSLQDGVSDSSGKKGNESEALSDKTPLQEANCYSADNKSSSEGINSQQSKTEKLASGTNNHSADTQTLAYKIRRLWSDTAMRYEKIILFEDVKQFIDEDVIKNLDFIIVKAGDLPKDFEVTSIKDVMSAIERIKQKAGKL